MIIQCRQGTFALTLAISLAGSLSAAAFIGVAATRGTIEVNRASVRGTANISEGAAVQTNDSTGQIHLENGVSVTLGQNSAAAVHADRLELLQGIGQVAARRNYGVEALGFRVEGKNGSTKTRVAYDHDRILVTAMDSGLTVSRGGVLIARLNPGATYFFQQDPNSGGDAANSAGSTSGSGNSGTTPNRKTGLSTGAKWGIVAGVAAAATGVGVGVYLSNSGGGNNASR
jgi:hypothetical protein